VDNSNHEHKLRRTLGLFPVTSIVIANMIGAGIFTTSGLLMSGLHSPLLMIGLWIAGGVIALCGALSYSELGAAIPEAGGEYIFLSTLFHPALGFLSGWVSFLVGFSAPIAASAIGVSKYLASAFPELFSWETTLSLPGFISAERILSILIILVFTLVHLRGISFGSRIQNILTVLKIVMIVCLVIFGFIIGNGSVDHFKQDNIIGFDFGGWKTIGLSLMWIMFAYSGWNASTYIGSEVRNPQRNLPASLLLGTGAVIILYICINALYVYAIQPAEMEGVISVGAKAAGELFGETMEKTFSLLISFALFSSLSAYLIIGPRLYFSMARQGLFFKSLAKVNPVSHAPSNAIALQAIFSLIMVVTGTFDQILTYMGFSLGIFPIISIAGVFKLRKAGKSNIHLPGFPLTALIYIITGTAILLLSYFERPVESSIALFTVLTGIPVYYYFKRKNSL
jgi:APA family basic amino acid/polyamine antiporter